MVKNECDAPQCLAEINGRFDLVDKSIDGLKTECVGMHKTMYGPDGRSGVSGDMGKKADWLTLWGIIVLIIAAGAFIVCPIYNKTQARITENSKAHMKMSRDMEATQIGIRYLINPNKELKEMFDSTIKRGNGGK